jgi:hypothetical protein
MPKNKQYVVTAYRWAERSGHSYVIGCFKKKHKAKTVADEHVGYRGGKYSCEVVECDPDHYDEDNPPKTIHIAYGTKSSSYDLL